MKSETLRIPPPHPAAASISQLLEQLRRRWRLLRLAEAGLYALALGVAVFALCSMTLAVGDPGAAIWLGLGSGLLGLGVLATVMTLAPPAPVALAIAADHRLSLAEKLASALEVVWAPLPGPVAQALLQDADMASQVADPALVAPWLTPRMKLALAAPLLAAMLAAGALWAGNAPAAEGASQEPSAVTDPLVSTNDIAVAAELIAADAAARQDSELASVAAAMQTLADQLDDAEPDSGNIGELAALLDRAGNRYGNPLHNWPPFEGHTGLADRMDAAKTVPPQGGSGGEGRGQKSGAASKEAGRDSPAPGESLAEVKPSSLPGSGDEGQGVGSKPPANQQESSAMGDEKGFAAGAPQPSAEGAAAGAGVAESNMAGTGGGPEAAGSERALPAPAGFAETQTLAAETMVDAERVRTSETIEAQERAVDDSVVVRQWPRQDAMPVERQMVPQAAAAAVARYFNRDEQIAP